MPMLTSDQSFALAQTFHTLAVEIGNYRFAHFDELSPSQRKRLEDLEFDVLNDSTKFNGLSIAGGLDELQNTLSQINGVTTQMTTAVQTIQEVGQVVRIAMAAVTLGAAIVSSNLGAIAAAVQGTLVAVGGGRA